MIFGFFGNKKRYKFKCPMCLCDYDLKFDPTLIEEFDYEYRDDASVLSVEKCVFCKLEFTAVYYKSDQVRAYDSKWGKTKKTYQEKIDKLYDELGILEDLIDENGSTPADEKKKESLENKIEKVEESFDVKDDKYAERQDNWQEKYQTRR